MDRVERDARLLCRADGHISDSWLCYRGQAESLAAAGYAIVRREPDEAAVERVADALRYHEIVRPCGSTIQLRGAIRRGINDWRDDAKYAESGLREIARAAHRAVTEDPEQGEVGG